MTESFSEERSRVTQRALVSIFFIQAFVVITYFPRIPELIDQIGVSFASWGLIIGFSGLGALLPLLITNRLIGRFGTKPVIRFSSVLMVFGTMSLAFTPNGITYFLFQSSLAFGISFFNIAVNAQSVMLQKKVGKVIIGKFHAAWSIGAALSAIISGVLASFLSLQVHLVIIPLIGLVAFEVAARYMLTPEEDGHHEEKQNSKKQNFFKSPPQLWLLSIGLFAGVFPEVMMLDWAAVFSKQVMLLNVTIGAIPLFSFTAAMIVGRLLINTMTKRMHISEMSKWGGIFGSAAMLIGVLSSPAISNQFVSVLVLSLFFALSGFGIAPMVPSFFSAAGHLEGLSTAQALSRMSLVSQLTMMGAKVMMGALAQGVGLQMAFLFPIVMMFIAGLLAGQVAKRAKKSETMENAYPPTGPLSVVDEL
jgi:predicted MFS family arabinose efflux permease